LCTWRRNAYDFSNIDVIIFGKSYTRQKKNMLFFCHRMLTKKNWLNDKHFSTCRLISGKNLYQFISLSPYFFHFSVRRRKKKHFRSSLKLEFSSSSSSSILIPQRYKHPPTNQHLCDGICVIFMKLWENVICLENILDLFNPCNS
jgi:hypothetical protein